MATIKKAQTGKKIEVEKSEPTITVSKDTVGNQLSKMTKAVASKKKMKNGGSLSGLNASTKRDKGVDPKGAFTKVQKKTLKGAKGKASLTKDKQLGATKMKAGGSIKKAEDGVYTPKQNRLARREKRVYDKYTEARTAGNTKRSGRLYDRLMDKQTKSINAGVNVQYKAGGKVSKKK